MGKNVNVGFNGTMRLVDLPAGVYTAIVASRSSIRASLIQESLLTSVGGANVPGGMLGLFANDNTPAGFTTVFKRQAPPAASANFPQFAYYNLISEHGADGECIAPYDGVTPYAMIQGAAGATTIEIWEFC